MSNHIILDIETLGQKHDAIITHIGAVKGSPFDPSVKEEYFYAQLDYSQQYEKGRKIDVSTCRWWLQQSDDARKEHLEVGHDVVTVLNHFRDWCGSDCYIWGNGNIFDCVLVRNLCDQFGVNYPTNFRRDLDFRTVVLLAQLKDPTFKVEHAKDGIAHHALHDAKNEMANFRRAVKALGIEPPAFEAANLTLEELRSKVNAKAAELCKAGPAKHKELVDWIRANFNGKFLANLDMAEMKLTWDHLNQQTKGEPK